MNSTKIVKAGIALAFMFSFSIPVVAQEKVPVTEGYEITPDTSVTGDLAFSHGFGLIYAPMQLTRELGVMEKMFPNAKIEWKNVFTTAQQRDGMMAGQLLFGSCSVGPYLQGWDRGVEWKVVQITSAFDGYLMVQPDGPNELSELIGTGKKISPGPNTAQYFAAQEYLRQKGMDPKALDRNWANLPHPDAIQAMIAKQLDGHWATADYALQLQDKGFKKIASFKEVFGGPYAVFACGLSKTLETHPKVVAGYAAALRATADWMKQNPKAAAEAMSKSVGGKVSAADFERYMASDLYVTTTSNADVRGQAASMKALGAISKEPKGPEDFYMFPDQAGEKW